MNCFIAWILKCFFFVQAMVALAEALCWKVVAKDFYSSEKVTELHAEETFYKDTRDWSPPALEVYLSGLSINWLSVRNVMEINACYGRLIFFYGQICLCTYSSTLTSRIPYLGSFDRGLIEIYHDRFESFNNYPQSYDLHSSFLLRNLTRRGPVKDLTAAHSL
ncbi:hypothetical protein LguiB_005397 [Lonicera macranthoides]